MAIFRLGNSCWKKKLPLSNGRVDTTLEGAKAFLKVRKDNISFVFFSNPINGNKNNKETLVLIISVLFGGYAILNAVLIVTICASASIFSTRRSFRSGIKRWCCKCIGCQVIQNAIDVVDLKMQSTLLSQLFFLIKL